jgi:DNA-binding MarR family transcriptional regulator
MKEEQYDIADDIGRLIIRINRLRRRFMAERLKPYGLLGPSYLFLLTLSNYPGKSQDFLVERHAIDKGNVAHTIKKLVKLGYIKRETDPSDRRRYRLLLTDKGMEMVKIIRVIISEWSHKISEGFSNSEWLAISGFLQRIYTNSEKHLN